MTSSGETYSELYQRATALVEDLGKKWTLASARERGFLAEAGNLLERASQKIDRARSVRIEDDSLPEAERQ